MDKKNVTEMDLEIAKLLKIERENKDRDISNEKIEEVGANKKTEDVLNITQDEVNEAIVRGLLEYDGKKIKFKRVHFFNEKISFMFPSELLKLEVELETSLTYTNYRDGINCLLEYIEGQGDLDSIKIKESILSNFEKSRIASSCPEEGAKKIGDIKVIYCTIENKIPGQNIFNLMFFVELKEGFVMANFNGFTEKYYKLWTMIYKAIMNTIEVE